MHGHWCPGGCKTLIPPGMALCAMCSLGIDKYIDENPQILAALHLEADSGIAALEALLATHTEGTK